MNFLLFGDYFILLFFSLRFIMATSEKNHNEQRIRLLSVSDHISNQSLRNTSTSELTNFTPRILLFYIFVIVNE